MNCKNCHRALRPDKSSVKDYPGTIQEYAVGHCRTCYRAVVPDKRRAKRPSNCITCDRPLRPANGTIADYPGTKQHKAGGMCKTCYDQEKAGKELVPLSQIDVQVGPEVVQALDGFMAQRRERLRQQERIRQVRIAQEQARARFIARNRVPA